MRRPHISIPLTPIIEDMWKSVKDEKPVEFEKPDLITINKSEKEILKDIRSGKFEKINVQFKNKKPELLISSERKDIKRIEEILRENKFQKIELIQKDGKVVSIVSQITKKLS